MNSGELTAGLVPAAGLRPLSAPGLAPGELPPGEALAPGLFAASLAAPFWGLADAPGGLPVLGELPGRLLCSLLGEFPGELLGRLLCSFLGCWLLGEPGGGLDPGELPGRLLCSLLGELPGRLLCSLLGELLGRLLCPLGGFPGLLDC